MKKLAVMLLALTLVLSMSVALVACGGNDGEESSVASDASGSSSEAASSGAESSAAASSEAASSEAESSAAASSEAASSEAESSAAASSEANSSEAESAAAESSEAASSEAPAGSHDYKTSPAGTNYATNSTYTVTRDGSDAPTEIYLSYAEGTTDWADLECTKLKDGVVADASAYDSTQLAEKGKTVQYAGTDKTFGFVFDLGDYYGDVKSIVFRHVRDGIDNGNNRGFEIKMISISDDGVNWTKASGSESRAQVAGAVEVESKLEEGAKNIEHFDVTYTFDAPVQCKFIRIYLSNNSGYVLQMEEVEIHN